MKCQTKYGWISFLTFLVQGSRGGKRQISGGEGGLAEREKGEKVREINVSSQSREAESGLNSLELQFIRIFQERGEESSQGEKASKEAEKCFQLD